MAYLQTKVTSHASRVRALYKAALRTEQSSTATRYAAVLLRDRFEKYRNELDFRKAKRLVIEGEQELRSKAHSHPVKYAYSTGGCAFQREYPVFDSLFDTWHPLEKAQYPEFFARRELRKQEYIDAWNKKYPDGVVEPYS